MKIVKEYSLKSLGSKAFNSYLMKKNKLPVPSFAVFQMNVFEQSSYKDHIRGLEQLYRTDKISLKELSQQLIQYLNDALKIEESSELIEFIDQIGKQAQFAVRSSATVEDQFSASFAGQFETLLDVKAEDLLGAIKQVVVSLFKESALDYLMNKQIPLEQAKMRVMVQVMIPSSISGIYFTANPQGILNEHVIVIGYGLGSGVVADQVPTTTVFFHPDEDKSFYETSEGAPLLRASDRQLLYKMAKKVMTLFDPHMDIEFAFTDEKLYVLQARPITTLNSESVYILDNSNIVESYPGRTTPLTFSFIQEAYASVFRGLARRLLPTDQATFAAFEPTFQQMLAQVNSRVYYQIQNWYKLLQLLPFSKKIIPIWQDMLGVRHLEVAEIPVQINLLKRLKIMGRMFKYFIQTPKLMNKLNEDFTAIQTIYQQNFSEDASMEELKDLFNQIKLEVLDQWDITLINDLYAFIFTGLLKYLSSENEVQQAIAGIEAIESMKPARALNNILMELQLSENNEYFNELLSLKQGEVLAWLANESHPITRKINAFLQEFGDRSPEELKLETKTFRAYPETFIQLLQNQLQTKNIQNFNDLKREVDRPNENIILSWIRKHAMLGIKNRESSRMNRTRIYGMMRTIFLTMAKRLVEDGRLQNIEDVFYLNLSDLLTLTVNTTNNYNDELQVAKEKFLIDQSLPSFNRLIYANQIFDRTINHAVISPTELNNNKILNGIGCSHGVIEGEVIVIENINQEEHLQADGKIIVTQMTDPGWVYLLTQAKGIIAEKGSLLSHTAIISRELGIPSIVNIPSVTRLLQTGDRIEMNGATGQIKRL